jgi:hypothetical protein
VLRAAGETETTQEDIKEWPEFDEGDPGFQLLTEEEIVAVILLFIYLFSSPLPTLLNFPFFKFFYLIKKVKVNLSLYRPWRSLGL